MKNEYSEKLVLSRDQVRSIDEAAIKTLGIPALLLMENAAAAVTQYLLNLRAAGTIVILCGPGNNGGDGLAVARQLAAVGVVPTVILITGGKSLSSDCQSNLRYLTAAGVPVIAPNEVESGIDELASLSPADWIVDSLLGTGVTAGLRTPFREWVAAINSSPASVLAVDVPSGLNCDDGSYAECTQANVTVTFVAEKRGFSNSSAQAVTGDIEVAPIGIPDAWIRQWLCDSR